VNIDKFTIASFIDHTNVKADATTDDIKKLCSEAVEYKFHSVCITPFRVKDAKNFLSGKETEIICVVGFPFGFTTTQEKVLEAQTAISDGATEIDMVINIGTVKDNNWQYVEDEIRQIADSIKPIGLKVIMEIGFLTKDELTKACQVAERAGAKFVKTATGYGPRTPTSEDIKIMREAVSKQIQIKASGGIHDLETAKSMIEAGADRIGTSSGLQIISVEGQKKRLPESAKTGTE